MRIDLKTWAGALSIALLSGLGALYVTRPASPAGPTSRTLVGRDYPGTTASDPLTADEIGYRLPRDTIHADDNPTFEPASHASSVPNQLPVIGVADGAEAKAYPVALLSRVEIVNDWIGGRAIAVTW